MKINNFNYDLVEYIIPSYKLASNIEKKVILISDLHGITKNKKKSNSLKEAIIKEKPHHIIIAGDIMQGNEWENSKRVQEFSYFLSDLSLTSPIFLSQGNHDLWGNNKINSLLRLRNFQNLAKIRPGRIYPLTIDSIIIDGFNIIGYTPNYELINNNAIQNNGYAHSKFIDEYNKNGPLIKDSKHIIEFVGHNPHLVVSNNNTGLGNLEHVNTFYTGHLHNGYYLSKTIKNKPDKYLDNGYNELPYKCNIDGKIDLKSINPLYFGKTNLCRGVIYLDLKGKIKYLQLRNNHFYINIDNNYWSLISNQDAIKDIITSHLKSLVISGGIKKYSSFNIWGDEPEITEVIYYGISKSLKKTSK